MSKKKLINNLFCLHSKQLKESNSNDITYTYCEDCGSISIKKENHFSYTIKPKQKQKPIEVDPFILIKNMKKNQNISYPNINNIYNLNSNDTSTFEAIKDKITIYFAKRKIILLNLQRITRKLSYSDLSFYHCLFLVDLYLSHNITKEMTEHELLYILIGFFLVSSKFKETDIYEPEFNNFNDIDNNLTLNKIKIQENKCLKFINYNCFIYSTYDWLTLFMFNGFVFEGEIEKKEDINTIHSYAYKILITVTPKNIFIKYSPLSMAISIIHIVRDDKIDKDKKNNELFDALLKLYDIKYNDYENCYKEIKTIMNKDNDLISSVPKLQNIKIETIRNQTPNSQRYENNFNELKNFQKKIENKNLKNEKKVIDISKQSKLNLKKKIKEVKLKQNIISSTGSSGSGKTNRNFHSIIVNNIKKKNYNFNSKKKNLEIIKYINANLPNIYNNAIETNKMIKMENETISGSDIKILKVKNQALKNHSIKNKIIKSRGSSFDNQNSKKYNIYNSKNKVSPLKISRFMRNGTYDTFENDKKISKLLYKNNTNIYHTDTTDSSLMKKNIDINHFNKANNSNNSNNNSNNNIDQKANYIIKNYIRNNNKIKITNNINIYKNYSNVYKDNNTIKSLYRQSTSDYFDVNERTDKQNLFKKTKNAPGFNLKKRELINQKDGFKKINSSADKNKEKGINYLMSSNNKKKLLTKLKTDNNLSNNDINLVSLKKIVKNAQLPKLKLKIENK